MNVPLNRPLSNPRTLACDSLIYPIPDRGIRRLGIAHWIFLTHITLGNRLCIWRDTWTFIGFWV